MSAELTAEQVLNMLMEAWRACEDRGLLRGADSSQHALIEDGQSHVQERHELHEGRVVEERRMSLASWDVE